MREKEARSVQKLLHTLYITEPDTVLRRDGEALVAVHANGREDHIPLHLLDRIVCFSGASISPAVIDACVKHDVGFSALSQSGRFCFRLNGPTTGNVLLRKKQYMTLDEYRNIRSPLPTVQAIREDEETRAAEAKPMSEDEMRAALLAKFGSKYKK